MQLDDTVRPQPSSGATQRMRAITLSREYGSGGGEIAARIAQRLGWQLIDHEVVVQLAEQLGITEAEAEARDERRESLIDRILVSMRAMDPATVSLASAAPVLEPEDYLAALHSIVEGAVEAGNAVIVGRGGQAILRGRRDVLHLRIVAPEPLRVAYVARREGLDRAMAQLRVQQKDRSRHQYVQANYKVRPDDAHLYDLVLNTGVLDLDGCVELALYALARKATRLTLPEEQLGPGAGLPRYPGRPEDFPLSGEG